MDRGPQTAVLEESCVVILHCFRHRVTLILLIGLSFEFALADEQRVDFNRDIRPLLSDKCFFCHGPDATHREADLRLDTENGATADLGGYRAITAGDVEASELIQRITASDADVRMPPLDSGKALSEQEIILLTRWIRQGAHWAQHWAYTSPQSTAVPHVDGDDWSINWIDSFILASLQTKGIQPAAEADAVTLVRRLHFDLTGLPPTPEQVDGFVSRQGNQRAYEDLVDDLLDSPHFGERMAMYWLDLVRYADTVGYHGDQDHSISPYRDYVIDAFNRNLPFDDFTREQLAGDLLPNPTIDQQVATGYNRLLQTSHEGGVQPKEYLAIYAADRVRNVSAVWMGATLGCAQCHDHKYDPYTTRDFYSMAAFFADVDEENHFTSGTNGLPTKRLPEIAVLSRLERQRRDEWLQQRERLVARQAVATEVETDEINDQIKELDHRLRGLDNNKRMTMVTVSLAEPRITRVLPRGNWLDESGPIVAPAIPQFLGELSPVEARATRLDLANWLTDTDNGCGLLTARVFANRAWYLLFGNGFSRSLDDLGGQGVAPDHPQLLDQLAIDFATGGWNVKRLFKQLVMSRTYRQSSVARPSVVKADPENRHFARQASYRLPAEMVRDNALAVSGLLVDEIGGASVRPYQPAGYYRHLNFPKRTYQHDDGTQQWRRGVYSHWQRQFLHPTLKALDAPSREECTAQRSQSNTPLAALALLNDPTFVEAARALALRVLQHKGGDDHRLAFGYRVTLSREPDRFEVDAMRQLLGESRGYFAQQPSAADELLAVGIAKIPTDVDRKELAAWTQVGRALLNLHETVTRR